jgi:diguanylate cyclase (GGDEF)-like protein
LKNFNKLLEEKVNERTQELHKINKKLKLLANTDELTSIDNRRHFFHKINEYIKLAKRNLTPLTYLSLDIDHFKRVNDTYGHQVGDEILKLFTTSVKNSLREIDLFGRVGGEEFAVCLQNTPIEGAKIIAEKIRKNVQKNFYMHKGEEIHITVSIGMAQYDFTCKLNQLMKKADDAMYAAKKNGRNRIEIGQ